MIETLRKAMDAIPDREEQNDVILATLGRLVMGEWGQMAENIGCLLRTGTVVTDPAVRVRKEYLKAPAYAGRPEGVDFAPAIEDALERGELGTKDLPYQKIHLLGDLTDKKTDSPDYLARRDEIMAFLEANEPLQPYIQDIAFD